MMRALQLLVLAAVVGYGEVEGEEIRGCWGDAGRVAEESWEIDKSE